MTKDQAIALAAAEFWRDMSDRDIAEFQLNEELLCMPFHVFHSAAEKAIGRPIWTHEFARPELLRAELHGQRAAPTFAEILQLIPEKHRRVALVFTDDDLPPGKAS